MSKSSQTYTSYVHQLLWCFHETWATCAKTEITQIGVHVFVCVCVAEFMLNEILLEYVWVVLVVDVIGVVVVVVDFFLSSIWRNPLWMDIAVCVCVCVCVWGARHCVACVCNVKRRESATRFAVIRTPLYTQRQTESIPFQTIFLNRLELLL